MSKDRTSPTSRAPRDLPPAAGADGARIHVTFLVIPRFNMMTLVTMIEPLRIANYLSVEPAFSWEIVSFEGPVVAGSNQLTVAAQPPDDRFRRGEHVFVLGSWGAEAHNDSRLLAWLRRQARAGAKICPVEMGCYIVARAGLMKNRRATPHWSMAAGFTERHPDLEVAEVLYTLEADAASCGGGLAGVDLMLRIIASHHGEDIAREVANQMMHHEIRPESVPQRRPSGATTERLLPGVQRAMDLIERNVAEPLSVPQIARRIGVSQRQLERHFKQEVGCTVVQFCLLCRLQHARVLLISTRLSIREIATASGFNTLSHFAYSFRKCFGRRPSEYRESWPATAPMPDWPGTLSRFVSSLRKRRAPGSASG
ncbi:MAG: GlxA family transcriptional regulator [Rhodobacteraceae bacterium]|nr:GlxA family transcriptional regulator [Paracoccaceae bacterium]